MSSHYLLISTLKGELFPSYGTPDINGELIDEGMGIGEDVCDEIRMSVEHPEVAFTAAVALLADLCMIQADPYKRSSLIDRLPGMVREMVKAMESEEVRGPEPSEPEEEDESLEETEAGEGEEEKHEEVVKGDEGETGSDPEEGEGEEDEEGEEGEEENEETEEEEVVEEKVNPVEKAGFKPKEKEEED